MKDWILSVSEMLDMFCHELGSELLFFQDSYKIENQRIMCTCKSHCLRVSLAFTIQTGIDPTHNINSKRLYIKPVVRKYSQTVPAYVNWKIINQVNKPLKDMWYLKCDISPKCHTLYPPWHWISRHLIHNYKSNYWNCSDDRFSRFLNVWPA